MCLQTIKTIRDLFEKREYISKKTNSLVVKRSFSLKTNNMTITPVLTQNNKRYVTQHDNRVAVVCTTRLNRNFYTKAHYEQTARGTT